MKYYLISQWFALDKMTVQFHILHYSCVIDKKKISDYLKAELCNLMDYFTDMPTQRKRTLINDVDPDIEEISEQTFLELSKIYKVL